MDRVETDINRPIVHGMLPSQLAFHHSLARMKGFSGPIGSGKSQALCQEAVKLTYKNCGRTGLIGAPTYPMLRDATQRTMFEILESSRIPFEYSKAENILELKDSGSRILFRAVDEFERLRGTNLAWFGLDELTYAPEGAWLRLERQIAWIARQKPDDPRARELERARDAARIAQVHREALDGTEQPHQQVEKMNPDVCDDAARALLGTLPRDLVPRSARGDVGQAHAVARRAALGGDHRARAGGGVSPLPSGKVLCAHR